MSAIEVLKGDKLIAAADAAADVAALKKHIDRERLTAVQEVEAQWKARYENFKRESVLILANKSTALEVRDEYLKLAKKYQSSRLRRSSLRLGTLLHGWGNIHGGCQAPRSNDGHQGDLWWGVLSMLHGKAPVSETVEYERASICQLSDHADGPVLIDFQTAEGQVKHLKKRLAAAEASLSKEVSSKTKALEEQAVAAEARAAQLEAEAAAHQQRAERAQQVIACHFKNAFSLNLSSCHPNARRSTAGIQASILCTLFVHAQRCAQQDARPL